MFHCRANSMHAEGETRGTYICGHTHRMNDCAFAGGARYPRLVSITLLIMMLLVCVSMTDGIWLQGDWLSVHLLGGNSIKLLQTSPRMSFVVYGGRQRFLNCKHLRHMSEDNGRVQMPDKYTVVIATSWDWLSSDSHSLWSLQ